MGAFFTPYLWGKGPYGWHGVGCLGLAPMFTSGRGWMAAVPLAVLAIQWLLAIVTPDIGCASIRPSRSARLDPPLLQQ
jgi:hypothetical protein